MIVWSLGDHKKASFPMRRALFDERTCMSNLDYGIWAIPLDIIHVFLASDSDFPMMKSRTHVSRNNQRTPLTPNTLIYWFILFDIEYYEVSRDLGSNEGCFKFWSMITSEWSVRVQGDHWAAGSWPDCIMASWYIHMRADIERERLRGAGWCYESAFDFGLLKSLW